jgi:hypothetical protein
MLFAGDNYYPSGGVEDLIGRAPTLVDVILLLRGKTTGPDWFNIYDTVADVKYDSHEHGLYGLNSEGLIEWAAGKDTEILLKEKGEPDPIVELPDAFQRNRHGSLYDRGSADSYYGRERYPHWWPAGTGNGDCVLAVTKEEIAEYTAGYDWNEEHGDKKSW